MTPVERLAWHHRLARSGFATEQAVYGVILVAGMIVVSGAGDSTSLGVLVTVVVTVVVFWAAHVYAGTVAEHGLGADRHDLAVAFRRSLDRSVGLLLSALVPCALLLLGTTRLIDDQIAIWSALVACILILGTLGWIAFRRRGAPPLVCLLGALSTAGFGAIIALLKVVVVH